MGKGKNVIKGKQRDAFEDEAPTASKANGNGAGTGDIVSRLWNLCHKLRDDGVHYSQYVAELAFLLFLKMAKETKRETVLPKGYRWDDLLAKSGVEQLNFYKGLLLHLGTAGKGLVSEIYQDATTALRHPAVLSSLVTAIDGLHWFSEHREQLGDLYEGLLEKNANELKSGAGQYFTPRPLVETMIAVTQPQPGEVIQDPACGTGGFLIYADRYIKGRTDDLFKLSLREQTFQRKEAFLGVELVPETRRLALMNLLLHDIEGSVLLGDTLAPMGTKLEKADVILTNPPFGTKTGGGKPTRDDFTYPTSNKQLAFLQHIYRGLKPGGRAAVVVPDNVLFEENTGTKIRQDLMDKCDLHTILRLPTGIFYAQGVKTNVLFFTRGKTDKGNTKETWVYDLRANMPAFGKRTPLTREHFKPFEEAYGKDANGKSKREDEGETGRFRRFTRESVAVRGDNLELTWLRDATDESESQDIGQITASLRESLTAALDELTALERSLTGVQDQR